MKLRVEFDPRAVSLERALDYFSFHRKTSEKRSLVSCTFTSNLLYLERCSELIHPSAFFLQCWSPGWTTQASLSLQTLCPAYHSSNSESGSSWATCAWWGVCQSAAESFNPEGVHLTVVHACKEQDSPFLEGKLWLHKKAAPSGGENEHCKRTAAKQVSSRFLLHAEDGLSCWFEFLISFCCPC